MTARHVAPALVHALLRAVRRAAGDDALSAMLAEAGVDAAVLDDPQRWFSSAEAVALADAAARRCRNENLGARAGAELWRMFSGQPGYLDYVRSAGSIPDAIRASSVTASKMSTGRSLVVSEVADDHLVLVGEYTDLPSSSRFYCGLTAGFYAQLPRAFAMAGDVVETACQHDGDDRCAFRISWVPDPALTPPDTDDLRGSAERVQRQLDQLEEVTRLTTELLAANRTDELLARITASAGRAVEAPRYLLAVRVSDRDRLRVHSRGFDRGEQQFAERLLTGDVGEADGTLVADVVHGDRFFGRLAACYPKRSSFTDRDRRLLKAYAEHAGAVLQQVASLEQASADRDTARALLDLARALAGAQTTAEVTSRLAETVPRVVDSDVAALWMWDADANELVMHSFVDAHDHTGFAGIHRLAPAQTPGLEALIASPGPRLLDQQVASDSIKRLLAETRVERVAVVPIVTHGRFVGVICAGFRSQLVDEDLLMARLAGLADHAAVATASVQAVEQISHQALHDNLTGLANRRRMQEHAESALATAARRHTRCALLFVDLDRFKTINDSLGHAAGDDMITQAAQRILAVTRPTDLLARFGGDEFLLLLPDVGSVDDANAAAARVVEALREPFTVLDRYEVRTSASVGIACFPDHGRDYPTLVRHADVAMYAAKNNGRNGTSMYRDVPSSQQPRSIELEAQLRHALEHDELEVHYQPQYAVADASAAAVEALVRWRHPTFGLLAPASFLPLAEESGLVSEVDAFVRKTALRQLRCWHEAGHRVRLALNASWRDLGRARYVDEVLEDVAAAALQPADVEVEISDSAATDHGTPAEVVAALRAAGIRVVVDDFGSGSGSVLRLSRCRVDAVKLAPAFLAHVDAARADTAVLESLVALAHSLGLTAVVEGVESVHQLVGARRARADGVQGYLLGKPAPAESVTALLASATSMPVRLLRSTAVTALPTPRTSSDVTASTSTT